MRVIVRTEAGDDVCDVVNRAEAFVLEDYSVELIPHCASARRKVDREIRTRESEGATGVHWGPWLVTDDC